MLVKRTPGTPLTEAERQQRRDAARARWAASTGGTVVGAAIGAGAGGLREAVLTGAQARAAAEEAGIRGLGVVHAERELVRVRRQAKADIVRRFFDAQLAQTEGGGTRDLQAAIESLRNPQRPTVRTGRAFNIPPIVGNIHNKLVYAREIWDAERRLRPAQRRLDAVIQQVVERDGWTPDEALDTAEVKQHLSEVQSIRREVSDLEHLQRKASQTRARASATRKAGTRFSSTGKKFKVKATRARATLEHKYRGGEITERLQERLTRVRGAIRAERDARLAEHAVKTERLMAAAERRAILQMAEAIRQNFMTGAYHSRILRATGRGGLIGAVSGLTATGIGMLAHHVATAGRRRRKAKAEKLESVFALEPLAKAGETPEERRMAIKLAKVYRRWIDRLLGVGTDPVNLGDGFVEAMGPHITEAFAQGMRNPPIEHPKEPDYRIDVDFDLLNPAQRRHIAEYALDRIVSITDQQREAIRAAIRDQAVLQGIGPYDVARAIKQAIGLTPYQQSVVAGYRTQLQQLDPRALERELRDKRYDRTVQAGIASNDPLNAEQIDAMVDGYHRKFVALRAKTIARTEALRASSYGGLARAQEVLDRHPELDVTKVWLATHDNRTRETHRDLNGKSVDGMLTHFVTSAGNNIRWPLDERAPADECINCRCTLRYVFKPKRGQLISVAA